MFLLDVTPILTPPSANVFGFWPVVGYILSALICIFLGYFLNPLMEPLVTKLFSKINSIIFRKNKKLKGKWKHVWHVDSARFPKANPADVTLKQFGNRVSSKYKVYDIEGKEYTYAMRGKIDSNNYVSGEWYDVYAGNTYHGTFMLFIDVNMDSMVGTWIGKSQDNKVKSGKWEWKRV